MASVASAVEFSAVGLTVTQGLGLWVALAPSLDDVRTGSIDDDVFREQLTHAECVIGGLTLVTGIVGSCILHSPLPLISAVAVVAALVIAYEISIRYHGKDYQND